MNLRSFATELKRRRVYGIAVAYIVSSWLIIQIATQVFPFFNIPGWIIRLIIWLLIVSFPAVIICAWAFEVRPEEIERNEKFTRARRTARQLTALIVVLTAAVAGLLILQYVRSDYIEGKGQMALPATEIASKSIAVLPFDNLSEDKANAYFVSGMRDEILTSLAQLRALNVRSRLSVDKYNGRAGDMAGLGRELGVANVIAGSVQKSGDDVLINVQLIDSQSGKHLWGQSYRRRVENVFDVQGEVAHNVADALRIKLAQAQEQRLLTPMTTNVHAHDLFLRAHALGAHADERSLEGKIALLQQAVAEDPHYAMAWGDLAGAYLTIADAYRAPRDVLDPMRHAARMAVQNDEDSGVGHIWLGAVSMLYDRNFPVAKRELEKAVALNPNSADAHRWLGWYLARVERDFVAGRLELQRARVLDPTYTWPIMFESMIEVARGKYESAMHLAEQVLEVDPHFFYDVDPIANVFCAEGRWAEAIKRYHGLPAQLLIRPNFQLAICYAGAGERDRAQEILTDLETLSRTRYIDHVHLAAIYAALRDKTKAFAALDQACEDRSARVSTPRFYPWLSPLFDDPRFAELEDKIAHSALASYPDRRSSSEDPSPCVRLERAGPGL